MSANLNPIFTVTPNVGRVDISTANTNRDGSGTCPTAFTAGNNGSLLSRVVIEATGTTTAGMVRLYVNDATNTYLLEEISVSAITPSGTVKSFTAESSRITPSTPLVLPNGYTLKASTHIGEHFHVTSWGGDF